MKVYIRSTSSSDSELQQALRDYNARKDRFDARMNEYDQDAETWRNAYSQWEEDIKTNPDTPRPDPNKILKISRHPRFDEEYSMDDAEHNLTVKALDSIVGQDKWIRVNRNYWVKVLSRTKNVKRYIYYKCQWFCDAVLGTTSFQTEKNREDAFKVDVPLEILDEQEFCDYVAERFFEHPDYDGAILEMIQRQRR